MADTAVEVEELVPLGVYTETLARLYWRQGYIDEALRIYHYLAAEKPDDWHFQEQVRVLEEHRQLAPNAPLSEPPPAPIAGRVPESATYVMVPDNQWLIDHLEHWLSQLQCQRGLKRLGN